MRRAMFVVFAATAAALTTGQVAAADGKAVYEKTCAGCHAAMAPKFGDKAAWAPLIKRGSKDLTASVIKGKVPMPPKGGAASDADAAAATEYMINAAK